MEAEYPGKNSFMIFCQSTLRPEDDVCPGEQLQFGRIRNVDTPETRTFGQSIFPILDHWIEVSAVNAGIRKILYYVDGPP